ncbi:MAG: beta-lactamase hydrolase domain-containing protein, partial [Bdellovibrionota bacterium]
MLLSLFLSLIPTLSMAALPAGVSSYADKIYISAAPTEAMFAAMAKEGVKTVIDLREPSELKGFEKDAAKKNGLKFVSAPVSRSEPLQRDPIEKAERAARDAGGKNVWAYCHSSSRASAWLAIHIAQAEHKTPDEAIAAAR